MAHVGVGRQRVAHLHERDLLAKLAQVDSELAAREAAAEHDHALPGLIRAQVVVGGQDHTRIGEARDGRHERRGPDRHDERVGRLLRDELGRDLDPAADLRPRLARKHLVGAGQLVHLVLEGNGLLALEHAAELGLFLVKHHVVAAARGSVGGVKPAGATARHEHATATRRGGYLVPLHLAPDQRVHRAAARGRGRALGHAGKAAQAAHDALVAAGHDLARQLGIRQKRAAHVDHVRFALRENLLHLRRIVEAAERGHGNADMLLYLRGQVHVAAVVLEH